MPTQRSSRNRALRSLLLMTSLGSALALSACGGSAPKAQPTELTPEQERVFEHGVDFVATLEGLDGRWRVDFDRDMQERVGSADFVGIVNVKTVLTETDPEQRVTYRLATTVTRTMLGESKKELQLRTREGRAGFTTIDDNKERIQGRDCVVYVKWYRDDNGARAAHFHLSPASDAIIAATETQVGLRNRTETGEGGERVIVHTNSEAR